MLYLKNKNTGECFAIEVSNQDINEILDEVNSLKEDISIINFLEFEEYENKHDMEIVDMEGLTVIQTKYKELPKLDIDIWFEEHFGNLF